MFHLPLVTGVDLADGGAPGRRRPACRSSAPTEPPSYRRRPRPLRRAGPADDVGARQRGLGTAGDHAALLDRLVALPMYGRAESLNLSTAAAVLLYATATAQRDDRPRSTPAVAASTGSGPNPRNELRGRVDGSRS